MKVEFQVTEAERAAIQAAMQKEHNGYYGIYGDGYVERRAGYFVWDGGGWVGPEWLRAEMQNARPFCWISQGGNALEVSGDTATYTGRRHGLTCSGFLPVCADLLRDAQSRGDWRYLQTSEPSWLPLETEKDNASK